MARVGGKGKPEVQKQNTSLSLYTLRVENGYSEKTLNRAPIKRVKKALLQQVLKIPEKVKVLFSINTK